MHLRWRSNHSGSSLVPQFPGDGSPCHWRRDFFSEPLPDLPEPLPVVPVEKEPVMTTAVASAPSAAIPRRGSKFTICMAVILIVVAIVFGTRSFLEITEDEPVSTLNVGPVTGVLAGHAERTMSADGTAPAPQDEPVASDAAPASTIGQYTPLAVEPAPPARASGQVVPSNVPQVAPAYLAAGSKGLPGDMPMVPRSARSSTPMSVITPPPSAAYTAATTAAISSESDSVLLDEVHTLERRGDEIMLEKRTEDALDLYHTALVSAEEYAGRKGANPNARDQVVKLLKKLGTLELQNSSTAEARATYLHARRDLLLQKQQGQWSRERAKALDEIESRILSLPRD